MKKLFLLLSVCLLSIFSSAQDRSLFNVSTPEECVSVMNEVLSNCKNSYQFVESFQHQSRYILDYTAGDVSLRAVFTKREKGAIPALEVPGVTVYELSSIHGKPIDLLAIWVKYVEPDADVEKIAIRGRTDSKRIYNSDKSYDQYSMNKDSQDDGKWLFNRSCW